MLNLNAAHCPINASISTPARPQDDSPWIWDLEVRSSGDLPLVEAEQNLTLQMPSGANMSLCKEVYNPYPSFSFSVVEGPELLDVDGFHLTVLDDAVGHRFQRGRPQRRHDVVYPAQPDQHEYAVPT